MTSSHDMPLQSLQSGLVPTRAADYSCECQNTNDNQKESVHNEVDDYSGSGSNQDNISSETHNGHSISDSTMGDTQVSEDQANQHRWTSERAMMIVASVALAFAIATLVLQYQGNLTNTKMFQEQLWKDCQDRNDMKPLDQCKNLPATPFRFLRRGARYQYMQMQGDNDIDIYYGQHDHDEYESEDDFGLLDQIRIQGVRDRFTILDSPIGYIMDNGFTCDAFYFPSQPW